MEFNFSFNINNLSFPERMRELKKNLQNKAYDFNESERKKAGFYYLQNLIDKTETLNFKNQNEFYENLKFIVQEFPVKNNNKVILGTYFKYFENFKRYIRKEFDLLPEHHYRGNVSLIFLILNLVLALFTGGILLIMIPFSLLFGVAIGNWMDSNAKKSNRVLSNSPNFQKK